MDVTGFVPPQPVLERYAHLAVQAGLRDGRGIDPGDTVVVYGHEDSKPLFYEVCCEVWRRGGHVIKQLLPENDGDYNFAARYYELASDAQLAHFPESHTRGLIDQADHIIFIVGDRAPRALAHIDPGQMAKEAPATQAYWAMRSAKERAGGLHWTIVLWATQALADEAGLDLEAYWQEIIAACSLDEADPVARWREKQTQIARSRDWLNGLAIDQLHVEAAGTDLWLTLGEHRRWLGGGGANIPSFEIFTSPDWRGTNGTIAFTEPLYCQGKLLRGVELEFRDGLVIRADATEGADLIQSMVAQPGGNRVGEYSLTDSRLSNITKFMAETLYDENVGGSFGNTHLAIGLSITETYDGDEAALSHAEWERLGYNVGASLHVDIVATNDRTVTATLKDGSTQVIYANGQFTLD
jgi:aminopeptidase